MGDGEGSLTARDVVQAYRDFLVFVLWLDTGQDELDWIVSRLEPLLSGLDLSDTPEG